MSISTKKKWLVGASIAALVVFLPILASSSHTKKLYVNDDAKGEQTGSIDKPFKTISRAMKSADDKTEIHVRKGTYKENIEIKPGVEIFGEDEDGVVIEAKDSSEPVVRMNNKTKINKVTLKGGEYGVSIHRHSKAAVIKCTIKDNKKGGVKVEGDDLREKRLVSITESEIKDNNGTGIYAEKRRLSIIENEISGNDGDGIDIAKGSIAWIADNKIKNNDKSGMKLRIDGSDIWTKSNSIRENKREGIEISFRGQPGRINIERTKIVGNKRFGIARVQRANVANNLRVWGQYLTFSKKNEFISNKFGEISDVVVILN